MGIGIGMTILVGTMTGTSEMVAQEVQQALETAGHQAAIQVMDNLDAGVFQPGGIFLICTSTYGAGDVPDNAQALFNSLETRETRPEQRNLWGDCARGPHLQRHVLPGRHTFRQVTYAAWRQARRRHPDARR